ncbi:unnamed protein product [Urochloa humidicola]
MGASSSTANPSPEAHEQREQETLASAALALPLLRAAFTRTSSSTADANALPDALAPPRGVSFLRPPGSLPPPPHFHDLLTGLGPAVASLFSAGGAAAGADGDAGWVPFLRGFNRCCARVSASRSLALLLRVYADACAAAGPPCGVQFQPGDEEGKVLVELAPDEIAVFLWMCWVMAWSGSAPGASGDGGGKSEPVAMLLPDVTHLVLSALVSAGAVADDDDIWGWEISTGGKGVKVQEFTSWMLSTASGLGNCLSRYVQGRFRSLVADQTEESSVSTINTSFDTSDVYLLTRGRAWAIALSLRNKLSEKFLSASVIGMDTEDLLYRSSVHGKGLSRFWSGVEGYKGPMLILLSAFSKGGVENVDSDRRWVIGVLTEEGFESKDTFYGSSGFLCAAHPIFRMLAPSGMTLADHAFVTPDSSSLSL